jgi:hypothetical protein
MTVEGSSKLQNLKRRVGYDEVNDDAEKRVKMDVDKDYQVSNPLKIDQ